MLVTGVAFIFFWLLIEVFKITLPMAAVVVGIVFILLGLLLGERIPTHRV